jgi:PAS domain-containing protein
VYKLMVVAGPNRGSNFNLQPGENWIGRQDGNAVVLISSKISKRHCVVTVRENEIVVSDPGSANGTLVNGVLTRSKKIKVGDRISVGEFVLQLMEHARQRTAPEAVVVDHPMARRRARPQLPAQQHRSHGANALALNPYASADAARYYQAQMAAAAQAKAQAEAARVPTDLKGRLLNLLDQYVMPFFYGLNLKQEWRVICGWIVAAFVIANLLISVQPLLDSSRTTMVKEIVKRARYMARQIADSNSVYLAARTETKTEIGAAEHADGVRVAVLVDLSNRIIAPALKQNSYLANGPEAMYAVRAAEAFKKGQERGLAWEVDSDTVAAYEPVKVLSSTKGQNEIVAMAVVSIDTSQATEGLGEMGVVYSETLILTGILAVVMLVILYKLTLKPFQVLVDDMDKVLKGDMNQVTQEFQWEEMAPLWDLINSALQRVPKSGTGMMGGAPDPIQDTKLSPEEAAAPIAAVADSVGMGVAICDGERKVAYLNPVFEEVTGIRSDNSVGEELAGLARDQAFSALIGDLFDRAISGQEASEDFEFGGVAYRVRAVTAGSGVTGPKALVLMMAKVET